jgi:hypothetical protein
MSGLYFVHCVHVVEFFFYYGRHKEIAIHVSNAMTKTLEI